MDSENPETMATGGAEPGAAAIPCPQCEYDLRGNTTSKCPECGCEYDAAGVSPKAWRERRRDRLFRILSVVAMCWTVVFFTDNSVFNGWFFSWLDRNPSWLRGIPDVWITWMLTWTPFNGVLYIVLAWLAYVATRTDVRAARFFGAFVTVMLLVVVATHVVLAVANAVLP